MNNKYLYLLKNIALFSLSSLVPKLFSMLIVPVYTSCLTTAEYGIAELITTTATLFIPLFTLGIQDAVMRYSLDESYPKEQVLSIAFRILTVGSCIILVGTITAGFLSLPNLKPSYLVFFFLTYLSIAFNNVISRFCRGIDRVDALTESSIVNSVITLTCNLLFLLVFERGLNGYLLAGALGSIASTVYCFVRTKLHRYLTRQYSAEIQREMISYSAPLIFSAMAWWFNGALDRYVLTWCCGVTVSGIYAVSFKIPNLFAILQSVFSQAWSISAVKEFDPEDKDHFISSVYNLLNAAMILLCSLLLIMNIPMAAFLYSNEFFEAWKYTPPLLLSLVFCAVSLFIGNIFLAVKDTRTLSVSTILSALVNIVGNLCMIPLWGAYGAAIATLLSNVSMWLIRQIILRQHIHLHLHYFRDLSAYVLLTVQMIVACLGFEKTPHQIILCVMITVLYSKEALSILKKLFLKMQKNSENCN